MPTVLTLDGFRFVIYYGDHEPAHVHVFRAGDECVINLGRLPVVDEQGKVTDPGEAPALRETYMGRKDTRRALEIAYENQGYLLARWEDING